MTNTVGDLQDYGELRARAVARLTGPSAQPWVRVDASAALGVLYELASSPETASRALALLHELQVHQVELDLQDEELRRSREELETALHRQAQLYDCAPVAYFTVDRDRSLRELNVTGARLLGYERDMLRGRSLDGFLTPDSVSALHTMFGRLSDGAASAGSELRLRSRDGTTRPVHAAARPDPAGGGFLVALIEVTDAPTAPGKPPTPT